MKGAKEVGYPRVITVNSQQVLGQIVTANRHKLHPLGQRWQQIQGCRHFQHGAQGRQRKRLALLAQFMVRLTDQPQCFVNLSYRGYHRQQNTQIAMLLMRSQHRFELDEKNVWLVQRHADPAPAQKRIIFFDRQIRQWLVATHIESTQGHRLSGITRQHVTVYTKLLFFTGEAAGQHERHFGAVQADTVSFLSAGHIGISR